MNKTSMWDRFNEERIWDEELGFGLDVSRMDLTAEFWGEIDSKLNKAMSDMNALEEGAIANPDEDRMVGHYWLRTPSLAPSEELSETIEETVHGIAGFADAVHKGIINAPNGGLFTQLLIIGIGGSALGPQMVSHSLGEANDAMKIHFFDNTDPDGMDRVLNTIGNKLSETLVVVISKSGGTKETRNGMLEAKYAFQKAGIEHANSFVAITGEGSELFVVAQDEQWLAVFPMWDWVGGRTSVMSAVGLLPAALQGVDIMSLLSGASAMDEWTRSDALEENPAAVMAAAWYKASNGKGEKDLVILPYKDRLSLMSKYLQQLIMESLGKELDLDGNVVNQGLSVYGNKGATDQHAYIQQLREGVDNFFVTFVSVLQDRGGLSIEVDEGASSGDYLNGFLLGTREALYEKGRKSMTLQINELNAFSLGAIIALFERTVGIYATLVNVNAYHQPGVEAGKKAAGCVLDIQTKVLEALTDDLCTVDIIAAKAGIDDVETAFHILEHLSANNRAVRIWNSSPKDAEFSSRK